MKQEVLRGMGDVRALEERSLTGTWDISDLQRWKWKASEDPGRGESVGKLQFSIGGGEILHLDTYLFVKR